MIERLKSFIASLNVTNSQFADACDIPRPSLSQILSGRNKKISDEVIGKIHRAYPGLNILWLLFGEAQMSVLPDAEAPFHALSAPDVPEKASSSPTLSDPNPSPAEEKNAVPGRMPSLFDDPGDANPPLTQKKPAHPPLHEAESDSVCSPTLKRAPSDRTLCKIILIYSDDTFEVCRSRE